MWCRCCGAFDTEENCDLAVYRYLADEYRQACGDRPYDSHAHIALQIGARVFNVPVSALRSAKRGEQQLCETRQQLMAFTRIVSVAHPQPNSWKSIGRAFNRHHATVIHATHKHGDIIAKALQA